VVGVGSRPRLRRLNEEDWVRAHFPGVVGDDAFGKKSDRDGRYNCIAFAIGDPSRWWWPDVTGRGAMRGGAYWPSTVSHHETLEAFEQVFEEQGYSSCADGKLEEGFEKIAIYTDRQGVPTHAARQLESGVWASKIGSFIDITHTTSASVAGERYGAVARFMKRRRV
jgi:hypothetical protein